MKAPTKKTSIPNLTRLSTSRNVTKMNSFANSTSLTGNLFGPRKNIVKTYSKSKPLHIVKKSHFLTPDTPCVATPDSLHTIGQNTVINVNTTNGKRDNNAEKGLYLSANLVSLTGEEKNSLYLANPVGSAPKSKRLGSGLALRNISNIPIDNTTNKIQCTPATQQDNQTSQLPRTSISSKNITRKSTPYSSKLKNRALKRAKATLLARKGTNERPHVKQNQRIPNQQKPKYDLRTTHHDSTNYSVKSMSAGTGISSSSDTRQGKTLTAQSMSLCSINDIVEKVSSKNQDSKEVALLPQNSTFIKVGENLLAQDCLKLLLSPIKDEIQIKQKEKTESSSSITQQEQSCIIQNMSNGGPRTSTPVDQGKDNAARLIEPEFSPIKEGREPTTKLTHGIRKVGKMRKSITQSKNLNNAKKRQELHSISKVDVSQTTKPNKNFLPLQASMCIEDDSDQENIQENITPELMPPKPTISSSKRKLEYSLMPFKPDAECCFLLDFKCTVKKACKIWMRSKALLKDHTDVVFPKDNLTYIK